MTSSGADDRRTRRRLIDAATRLFAAKGFRHVTVREICRDAKANVAAVNYHFRDKMGLYREVVSEASAVVREVTEAAVRAGAGKSAEGKLRAYVRVHCQRIFSPDARAGLQSSSLQQLIHREMNDPTPALETLVDHALRPRFEYLGEVVGALLDLAPGDERVVHCAVSVHAQVITFRPNAIIDRMPARLRRAFRMKRVAAHIEAFSLAGISAYRRGR